MPEKKQNKMSIWLLSRPAIFAVVAFLTMTLAVIVSGAILPGVANNPLTFILITAAFAASAFVMVRMLPGDNLDRRSFVALNNAQMAVTSATFISSTLLIVANARSLMMRLLWMESHSGPTFMIIMIAMALFYLYLCGIYIGNLYAKYRRIRAMGVPMWKTLATAPFGFCMLWIPGYLMDEKSPRSPALTLRSKWYSRLTDWVVATPARAAGTLVALILFSGFFFGFSAILLTLTMAIIFATWAAFAGAEKMRKNIGGKYATTAIIINILVIIGIIAYAVVATNASPVQAPTSVTPEIQVSITDAPVATQN